MELKKCVWGGAAHPPILSEPEIERFKKWAVGGGADKIQIKETSRLEKCLSVLLSQ